MSIKLIVGLRNPGADYAQTRHNVGQWFVDLLAHHSHTAFRVEKKLHCEVASITTASGICRLALPLTFMNHSGLPLRALTQFYQYRPDEILVVHDDLDLMPGRIKLKTGGGHGGHNGLRDILSHLGHADFHRLRIGIGHPGQKELVVNYVLGKPILSERQQIEGAMARALAVMPQLMAGELGLAMNQLNTLS